MAKVKSWDDMQPEKLMGREPWRKPADAAKAGVTAEGATVDAGAPAKAAPAKKAVGSTRQARGAATEAETVTVSLRIPRELAERVDQSVRSRPVKIPRHTWLLEAVVEKLDRERGPP